MCTVQLLQQGENFPAGSLVQIAGRLIGKQDIGLTHKGARQRDALLLSAGEFAGQVSGAVFQTHFLEPTDCLLESGVSAFAPRQQRQSDIFQRGEVHQQVGELPDEPNAAVAVFGQFVTATISP
jgi:hypothetical protein